MKEIIGEVTKIEEIGSGIIRVCVDYKDGDKLLEEITYPIADSPPAIASFQDNVLPKEITAVIEKKESGGYDVEESTPIVPIEKIYDIKVGDVIEEKEKI